MFKIEPRALGTSLYSLYNVANGARYLIGEYVTLASAQAARRRIQRAAA